MYNKIIEIFAGQFIILSSIYILVLAVVLLDLWSGIRKARNRGEYRSSYGLRRTVEKIAKYFNMLLVLTVIDVMQITAIAHLNPQISFNMPLFPILTVLGAIFLGIIEFKSIYEKADDKDRSKYQDAIHFAGKMLKEAEADKILSKIAGYLRNENTRNDKDGS